MLMDPPSRTLMRLLLASQFLFLFLVGTVGAMMNPAAMYCSALSYDYTIETTRTGAVGYCVVPSGEKLEAWSFLEGKVGREYSYCAQQGYRMKPGEIAVCNVSFEMAGCTVCILEDGSEVEVTRLMHLGFDEGICGDTICAVGENHGICPSDCASGSADGYCDRMQDSICDLDCPSDMDLDCRREEPSPTSTSLNIILVLGAIVACGLWCIRK